MVYCTFYNRRKGRIYAGDFSERGLAWLTVQNIIARKLICGSVIKFTRI